MNTESNNTAKQLDVLIPTNFQANKSYLPIAQLNSVNGENLPAIGQYSEPPQTGTFVLGAIGGTIQWIATQDC
jgi:hypothetical protein